MSATGRPVKIIRKKEVTDRTGYSDASIYRLMAEGKFPKNIKLGARAVGWLESDIDDWIMSKVAVAN